MPLQFVRSSKRLNLERMDEANDPRVEFRIDKHLFRVSLFQGRDRDNFVGQAVEDLVNACT